MINNSKGLSSDLTTDLPSHMPSHFNPDAVHDMDPSMMFYPTPMDLYGGMSDELHQNPLLPHIQQKGFHPPQQQDISSMFATQINPRNSLLGFRKDNDINEEIALNPDEKDDDDGDSDSDAKSNSSNKRGKYRTYTDDEKAHIITFMMKHGIQKTLEVFTGGEHKITKRKLKSWLENQSKVKGVKGRKSTDPVRDEVLFKWCSEFEKSHGRPPSRKETTERALELSGDPNFQASKGWLDKFSRKYHIEFTPLKIIPPRGRKKMKTDSESGSATSSIESALAESISPLKDLKTKKLGSLEVEKTNSAAISEESAAEFEPTIKTGSLFSLNAKHSKAKQVQQQRPTQPLQQQQHQPEQQTQPFSQLTNTNMEENPNPNMDAPFYPVFPMMDNTAAPPFGYPFFYPMDYANPMPYSFNPQQKGPVAPAKNYPFNPYPLNMPPMNFNLAENFQRLHQMMQKEEMNLEKQN
jgi:hypothetical protein